MTTYLNESDVLLVQGSGKNPYKIRKIGGVVDCSCPAWRNLGGPIDIRVCKHIKANVDPNCLLPQAQAAMGFVASGSPQVALTQASQPSVAQPPVMAPVRLTKTGKVSTAVGGAVVKDTAPPCLLAHKWETEDPIGWWISSKFDGVRNWYDGEKFISRLGNEYHAPEWFKALLPKGVVLDGELWVGRKKFRETISAVKKLIPTDSEWQTVSYVVFDAPEYPGPFEDRMKYLEGLFEVLKSGDSLPGGDVRVVEQIKCKGADHLKKCLVAEESLGGEGVMLRSPGSLYESGRSKTCLKVKTFFDDEAVISGYTEGKGKHKGRVGAFLCDWQDKTIEIGTGLKDSDRINPPAIGTRITFRYQELTPDEIPRFASYIATRTYE